MTAYFGLGDGRFATSGTTLWSGTYLLSFAARDLDGNGKPDLLLEMVDGVRKLYVALATRSGAFATPTMIADNAVPGHVFLRDFNGDGHADVIGLTEVQSRGVSVMLGDGAGSFGSPLFSPTQGGSTDMAFADVNGDGHLDVVIPGGDTSLLLGNGDGTFRAPMYFEAAVAVTGSDANVGDVDDDGRLDIVAPGRGDQVSVLYGRCLSP